METNTAAPRLRAILLFPIALLILLMFGTSAGIVTAAVGSFFYIALLFPLFMGYSGGYAVTAAIQLTRTRSTRYVLVLSVLTAAVIYGTYHYGRYFVLQLQTSLELFSSLTAALEDENLKVARVIVDYVLKEETGQTGFVGYMLFKAKSGLSIGRFYSENRLELGSALAWLYWALEFGIILYVTAAMGRKQMQVPSCESCGSALGRERHLGGTAPANESLVLDLIKRNDAVELGKLLEKDAGLPSVELYMQRCEACGKSAAHLTVRRASLGARGMLQFSDVSKASLPPRDSMLFLNQLRFEID